MDTVVVAIGTKKGLFLATTTDRTTWSLSDPHFLMSEVPSVGIDTRGGRTRLLVGGTSEHWGPTVSHSDDLGATWTEVEQVAIRFPADTGTALERVWQVQPATDAEPGVVWAGCQPISLWRSDDGGEHFDLVRGLWDHPHRQEWGAGYGGAAAHSVAVHPTDPGTVHVAMSTGGVYRTTDGGASWQPRNEGISAYFLPGPTPEFGQCVHKLARDPVLADRLYAQNHHGVYRSDDSADTWTSIADGLPSDFGFVMLTHPRTSGTVWTVPLVADGERIPPQARLAMHRSRDAGATWERLDRGLPTRDYNTVLRDAAAVDTCDPVGVYVGTRGGEVYVGADEGDSFTLVGGGLPDVLCVRAAVVPG